MAEYLSPGVYVEEYDNGPRPMEGVSTSTAGFVGMAERGPVSGTPVFVTGLADFSRQFGAPLSEFTHGQYRYLYPAVESFFANGGTRCYVARVAPEDAQKAEKKAGILTFTAANEGSWGNKIQVFADLVLQRKMQLLKEENNIYTAKSTDGFREGDLVCIGEEYNRITSIMEKQVTFEAPFKADVVDDKLLPHQVLYLVELRICVRYEAEEEIHEGMSLNPVSPDYLVSRMKKSQLVTVEAEAFTELENPLLAIYKEETPGMMVLEGGLDGTLAKVSGETFIGKDLGPGKRSGIQAFLENDQVSMMAVPGVTIPEVTASLLGHCESLKSRFAVLDMPKEAVTTEEVLAYRNTVDTSFGAMYHPWLQVYDRSARKPGFIPPSGAVMGIYARTDTERGVHKAPANEVVRTCTGLSVDYNRAEQDILNPQGVNLIRALPGQGIRVWGARTAGSNAAFRYVNVRRLFIYVEESIKANTNWVVFEPNDPGLWSRVSISITSFLDGLFRSGMLAGGSPDQAFFVQIGPETMTEDDIANGRLICNVGIAPSKPAEFVIFRVSQKTAEQ